MHYLNRSIWCCRCLCRRIQLRTFKSLCLPSLLYGFNTWILNSTLMRDIDEFAMKGVCRISGYHWSNHVVRRLPPSPTSTGLTEGVKFESHRCHQLREGLHLHKKGSERPAADDYLLRWYKEEFVSCKPLP